MAWGRHWFWGRVVGKSASPHGTFDRSPYDTPPREKTSLDEKHGGKAGFEDEPIPAPVGKADA